MQMRVSSSRRRSWPLWASGSYPGIAAVTRYFAIAAAAGTGMRFADPDVLTSVIAGGASAFAAAFLAWLWFGLPPADNVIDWRAGVRRAFVGVAPHLLGARIYDVAVGCM